MNVVDIKVWGDFACFTRPEFKVERVSYPVMTPSAARGVLEAIYWKPQFRYRIRRIGVLKQGTQFALLRNEIKSRQSGNKPHVVVEDDRAQRTSLILQDVCYRIVARIELRDGENNIGKHLDCLRRRARAGQCFHRPFLGCREFAAHFAPATEADEPPGDLSFPIGTMLLDTAYIEDGQWYQDHKEDRLEFWRHHSEETREAKGYAKRLFFQAKVENGWLCVRQDKYDELRRLENAHGTA